MKRIKLVLSLAAAAAMMSLAAGPVMADVDIERSGGSHGNGFTSIISSSDFGGFGDSDDTFVFFSTDSDFDDLDVEGSHFDLD